MTAQPFKTMEEMIDSIRSIGRSTVSEDIDEIISRLTATQEVMELRGKGIEEEYEPYMGWCDVKGCNNEAAANGSYYKDTGYWCLCSDHSYAARSGSPQPKMKQSAVDRENSRDKKTGYLPIPPTEEQ